MAKILSGKLEFEIVITDYVTDCVYYEFFFRWENTHILNDNILKRSSSYWKSRKKSGILANNDKAEFLFDSIKQVLENNEESKWETLEPDVAINIEPLRKNMDSDTLKYMKLPDDSYKITVFIDSYNFKNQSAYSGAVLSFILFTTRSELEKFLVDLQDEYKIVYNKSVNK